MTLWPKHGQNRILGLWQRSPNKSYSDGCHRTGRLRELWVATSAGAVWTWWLVLSGGKVHIEPEPSRTYRFIIDSTWFYQYKVIVKACLLHRAHHMKSAILLRPRGRKSPPRRRSKFCQWSRIIVVGGFLAVGKPNLSIAFFKSWWSQNSPWRWNQNILRIRRNSISEMRQAWWLCAKKTTLQGEKFSGILRTWSLYPRLLFISQN